MIAIICPTRARKDGFERMFNSAFATANEKRITIFSGSNGDDEYVWMKYPIDMPTVYMWNDLVKAALANNDNKLFMLGSDDMIFATPGWDNALIEHYNGLKNKIHVYHLQDSRDTHGTPHPIFSREWIDAMGWMLPPYFMHWKVDTWSVEIAKHNNCFTHLHEYQLIHDKPNDRGIPDQTHLRIRQNGWLARDNYVASTCSYLLEYEKKRLKDHINA